MEFATRIGVWLPALLATAVLLTRCDPAALGAGVQDVEQSLQGTWLREYRADGVEARRVLVLQPGHVFRERLRTVDAQGRTTEQVHEGTWFYDGTNLKRKYTSMNGEPPSRLRVPFATFQIAFDSPDEFHGVDHIHGRQVRYRRIADAAPGL